MFWVIFVIVVIVILLAIINGISSRRDKYNEYITHISLNDGNIDKIYYRNKNYEYIIDIVSKCGYNRPIKLSDFLNDIQELQRQSDLYKYLTSEKFRNDYYFLNVSKIETNGKPDLILSIDTEKLNHENYQYENLTSEDLENILLDLEDYTEDDDYIELSIRGINFRDLRETNIGSFDGYIAPEINNKYDKHAIGIYGYDGTHFGFIEKGQEFLYNKIEHSGGVINVSIEVHTFINEKGENRLSGTIKIDKEYLM